MKLLPVWIATLLFHYNPAHAGQEKYWIFFRDKGGTASGGLIPGVSAVHPTNPSAPDVGVRALSRRSKMFSSDSLIQPEDFPLHEPYLRILRGLRVSMVASSRWLNAVSAIIPHDAFTAVEALPFVASVSPVRKAPRRTLPGAGLPASAGDGANALSATGPRTPRDIAALDYGPSFAQADAVRVPDTHGLGITGRNVIVGLLDSGFRWRAHRSLASMRVLAEYDFISGDDDTADGPGDPAGGDSHGTLVLSVLGGYAQGKLIGPAFGAEFLLAKTEDVSTETQVEEDYWAAGIEWLEANGADVINSSVGYDTWDNGSGYSWGNGDFDGQTSIVAKAAQRAARLGVVLCVSMGNEGNGDGVTGTMLTPADVDTAISVGAATVGGFLSTSSSTGPTSDGRVKPDVIAPGVGVYTASTGGFDSYSYQSGTSVAAPIAAGVAALLLSARPELTPTRVRDVLRASADTARVQNFTSFPNNFTGWGYLDALAALALVGPVLSNVPSVAEETDGALISVGVLSGAGVKPDSVLLRYWNDDEPAGAAVTVAMNLDSSFLFPGSGRYAAMIPPHPPGTPVALVISAVDSGGSAGVSPAPLFHDRWIYTYGSGTIAEPVTIPAGVRLLQNYPNPFSGETGIVYDLPADGFVRVSVFNVLGQLVATPFEGIATAGDYGSRAPVLFRAWSLPAGVYLCRLSTPSGVAMNKMMLVR